MGKTKNVLTGRILKQSDSSFDWSLYDNGYTGGASLKVNKSVKTKTNQKMNLTV